MQHSEISDTSTGTRARAVRSGERSTGCLTGARSTRRSGRSGPSAGGRGPATSRSAAPRRGCARCLDQARAGVLPGMVRTGVSFADAVRRVPALRRARPRPQAVDARRLPLGDPGAPAAGVRLAAARGRDRGSHRGVEGHAADEQPDQGQAAHGPERRSWPARDASTGCRSTRWPTSRSRGTGARRRSRSSRPRRSWRWCARRTPSRTRAIYLTAAFTGPAPRRARRAPLARRRLRRPSHPRVRLLRRRAPHDAEERQGPVGAAGAGRRRGARPARPARVLDRRGRSRLPGRRSAATSTRRRCRGATRRRWSAPSCGRCGSTTCATRSARG